MEAKQNEIGKKNLRKKLIEETIKINSNYISYFSVFRVVSVVAFPLAQCKMW